MKTENPYFEQCTDGPTHLKNVACQVYAQQKKALIDSEQITDLLPMIHKVVQRVVTYIKPPLTYDDLISAGTVGLVKAAQDFNPDQQAEFKTYAYIRIRGSVLDELRNFSFVPANVDKQIQLAFKTSTEMTKKNGSLPTDQELAEKLQISISKLHQTFENARAKNFVSIDTSSDTTTSLSSSLQAMDTFEPDQQFEKAELIEKLTQAVTSLNERQRQIIILYYHKELTMKQIAEVFNITEPRVSQLHAAALFNLSVKLRQWKNDK